MTCAVAGLLCLVAVGLGWVTIRVQAVCKPRARTDMPKAVT